MKNTLVLFCFFLFSTLLSGQDSILRNDLKKELQQEQSDSTKVKILINISNSFSLKEKDSSLFYFNEALKQANSIGYKPILSKLLFDLGHDFYDRNSFERAIQNYLNSASIYSELGELKEVAKLNNYIGYCYINLYAEDKAIEYYLKSLTIYEQIGNEDGIAMNFIDIGNLYYDQENYEYAKKYFQDALTIYEKLENKGGIATCYTNLGNAFADDGDFEDGIDFFKQSIILEEEFNDQIGIAINYNNLGDCNIQLKQYKQAQDYFFKSLKIAKEINNKELIAIVYLNMADVQIKLKKFNLAINYATQSYNISKEIGKLDYQLDNLDYLAISYEALGNISKALSFHKQRDVVKDSLFGSDKRKKVQLFNALNELEKTHFTITDLSNKNEIAQLKYENEKKITYYLIIAMVVFAFLIILSIHQQTAKKKAYNLLEFRNFQINRMNNEIQEQRDYLKQLNKTKDKFFSIIAHDLKNPFNSIKGFTELLIDNSHEYEEEKKLKFLRIIKDSTNKASALLNNLLIWANSQSGNLTYNPKKTKLVKDVIDVVSFLEIQAVKKEIEIYNNVDHNLSVMADENMLNTILRNLISNAIKFTNPKGEVRILSLINNGMVEVIIKDNGVGISEGDIEKIFSIDEKNTNVGTANEQGSGLGLILCKDFVEKHGGKIWVNSVENEGSEFVFTLPLWEDDLDE